jgi:hypothetical protein
MSAAETGSARITIILSDEERARLMDLLDGALRDTHVEARRTEAPAYQKGVHHQEAVLRALIEKLRRA